jgi:hypothetical protein
MIVEKLLFSFWLGKFFLVLDCPVIVLSTSFRIVESFASLQFTD